MRETCWWNLGTTYRRQALAVCEGSPPAPRSPTGHPRNRQNGSEECPRSSYHAGRGHPVQGGRRPIMKMPFRVLVWPNLLIERLSDRRALVLLQLGRTKRHTPISGWISKSRSSRPTFATV